MLNDIVEATHVTNPRVRLRFEDGTEGELDLSEIIRFNGIFEPLREPSAFAQSYVNPDMGTICWPNGADLAPERLYAELVAKREAPG